MSMRRFLTVLWLVAGTCSFTYWWYNSLLTMPLSEELWTWFNGWFDGQHPGVASDLEFIVVVGIGFGGAFAATKAITTLARRS
jgi:hypothetical protein